MGDLGLPPDYNPRFIPSPSRLQAASERTLEQWTSFIMTNKSSPKVIAEKLDVIVDGTWAALNVTGPHVPKAIKLGLELEMRYWVYDNRLEDWHKFMMEMMRAATEVNDAALKSEIYRAWSTYHFVTRQKGPARVAMEKAIEYAEESQHESQRLLARAESFNLGIREMPLKNAQVEAQALIAEAERIRFPYVKGRAYLTLALRYQMLSVPQQAFSAAQQALVCFTTPDITGMQAYAVTLMLGNIQFNNTHSRTYRQKLLGYLTTLAQHDINPQFRAAVAHLQASEAHYQGRYADARCHALEAWCNYRHLGDDLSCHDMQHMLGMIETKDRPARATRHLDAARAYFEDKGETVRQIHVQHARAWVPYTHGDPATALTLIDEALALVDSLQEQASQGTLRDLLVEDREKIVQALRAPTG
ncbi:hypothetical protein [Aggregatilinea lenta]|uniref:hypothetical protein n=1 Tax=Aggregatilinea lenta TaxID=913108 RepID=UPI000E5C44DE|nr:hypothetical protein [Aggregatilinea lenta]